ncbi:hypothetical protein GIB67_029331, partial [Kingdonia uniflora]
VPWSEVTTNHSTSPFADDMYEKIKDFLIEYEVVVAIVKRAVIKALEKQYNDILTPLKDSIPKKLGFHVQKLTRRQSTTLYSVPNQILMEDNHEEMYKIPTISNGSLGAPSLTSFFEHSILVVTFKFAQNHSQVETSLDGVGNKRIDTFLVDPWVRFTTRKGTVEMSASTQLELSKMAARLLKGICLGIEEGKGELKNGKVELKKKVARLKSDMVLEGKRLDVAKAGQEGYSKAEVKAIMDGTYVKEDEVEKNIPGVVGGLDGVSPRTELENQGEDNEKELKEMCLRITELDNELAKEKDASASLLTSQVELQDREEQEIFN